MSPTYVKQVLRGSLLALVVSLVVPALAAADSPDVTSAQGTVTNVAANGAVTVEVHGTWNWPTHGKDCNTDRAGVGIAIDWHDPNAQGNFVTTLNGVSINVGILGSDNFVYPAEPSTVPQITNDPSAWHSRCGQFINGVSQGTFGTVIGNGADAGKHFLTHTYSSPPATLNICALTYDPHGSQASGAGSTKDITAGGNGHNDDNSAEKNGRTPAGNTCKAVNITRVTTNANIGTPFKVGDQITDQATLSGATLNAGGSITFYLFGPGDTTCSGGDLSKAIFTSTTSVTGNGSYTSGAFTTTAAGTYRWIANYTPLVGDTSNSPTANGCNADNGAENVVVGPAGPTVTTNASPEVTLGGTISDGATLAGGVNPTGDITFNLYGPDDATCSKGAVFTTTTNVSGNGIYSSAAFKPTAAGTYRWVANYGGDTNNKATTNGCNGANENVVVKPPPPPPPPCTANCSPPPPSPNILIVKTGPAQANAGDVIPYNLDVKNTGPVSFPEANVALTDALCGVTPTLVSKNGDSSSTSLDPGETWSYTCSVPTAVGQTFVHNVASVCGTTASSQTVCSTDDADTVLLNQGVAPLLPGVARLRGPTGCIAARTHVLTVTGRRILRVSFYLDGRYIGTRTKPNRGSRYTMTIRGSRLARGSHVVLAKVTYQPDTNPQSRTLTLAFARCARAVTPKFTG